MTSLIENVFQAVNASLSSLIEPSIKSGKPRRTYYAASTLVLALELVRVFDFSLGNLSKSFSLDRLHWPTSGFAVSCK